MPEGYDDAGMRQAPPCPGGFLYQIRSGDTLYSLARRYGTTVGAITAANPGIDPNALRVGQLICIPVGGVMPPAPPTAACPPGSTPYVIRRGDTFYRIAQRFGVPLQALIRANPRVNPNALQIGQLICVPVGRPPVPVGPRPCTLALVPSVGSPVPYASGFARLNPLSGQDVQVVVTISNVPPPSSIGGTSYAALITVDADTSWFNLVETTSPGIWTGVGVRRWTSSLQTRGRIDVYPGPVLSGSISACR